MIPGIFESPWSCIVWWPIVRMIEEVDDEMERFKESEHVRIFPDGSLQASGELAMSMETFLGRDRMPEIYSRADADWRSIGCWKPERFQLASTEAYFNSIGGEEGFWIFPNEYMDVTPNELTPESLRVQVRFWRRLKAERQNEFANMLRQWSASVTEGGIFEEGPAKLVSEVMFKPKAAEFRIDVSRSGQNTLNWLSLSILNFGAKFAPVTQVYYGSEQET